MTQYTVPKASPEILGMLNEILEMELSGVTRYLHYALMVRGPGRIPITQFFKDQAAEALTHATIIGEKITSLGGHPSLKVAAVKETNKHSTEELLEESLEAEKSAIALYKKVLPHTEGDIALEELIREFVRTESEHVESVYKMLSDRP
jgi:bacterioferritin